MRLCTGAGLLTMACSSMVWINITSSAMAQPPAPPIDSLDRGLQALVIATLRQNIPESYTDDSKWGRTKYQTVGVKLERDGLKLELRRRKKHVNEGLWKLYRINLADPERWEISFSDPQDLGDGRVGFEATFATPLQVLARASNWERGVQLFSVSAQADATVRLHVRGEMRLRVVAAGLAPGIRLEPTVTEADLKIERFRLNRISQLHGPLVRELGEEAHDFLQREVNQRREKLTNKMNQQIEKNADKLTLSWAELSESTWNRFARPSSLPPESGQATAPPEDESSTMTFAE